MRKVKEMEVLAMVALLICILSSTNADTDPNDVSSLNALYTGLNSPPQLNNWKQSGGDPCGEHWTGITCSGSRVTEIKISSQGLTGNMGYALDKLTSVTTFDISNNNLGNQIPFQLPPNVTTLNLAGCNFNGALPYSISQMSSLKFLDFSYNEMSDNLPQSFQSLTGIKDMYLQNNQFTGTLDVLANLPLDNLNVENNRFTGWVPQQLRGINIHANGNSFSTGPAPPPPPGTPPATRPNRTHRSGGSGSSSGGGDNGGGKSGIGGGAIAGIVISILVVGAIVAFFVIKKRSRKSTTDIEKLDNQPFAPLASQEAQEIKPLQTSSVASAVAFETPAVLNLKPPPFDRHKSFDDDDVTAMPIVPPKKVNRGPINAKLFSVADLQIATDSFNVENLIGEGSIGRVYRAQLDDGKVVAVKKINSSALTNSEDFLDIVSEISNLHHPNVTELIGYCSEHGQHLLVYEFHKNGSLHEFLHLTDDEFNKPLTWNARVKIALGTARALEYLHEVCSPSVIHKNFKSANILLDVELNPHLSDCVLASLVREPDQASGYSAPEVAMSGQYTIKSDVYSFGVVMLELLTGRTPFDSSRPRNEQSLVRWATPQLHDIDALSKMVDPALKGLYPVKSLSRFADVIALCVQPEPEFRPPMSEVVQALVRLVQRANMSKRTFGNEAASTRADNNGDGEDYTP
ncbi:protein strubbelig-receptor family 6 [Phtheirospermum japonicum]|uniref:Protein strubbelig-receptor family 6 n=1 Tax=Phtheirospermum japonicum TaxID=374723 RepID=A0A830C8I9_9LAMI|nr:protein strubbelig-receptor family 6 [Phtheirospermum japonicum]